MTESSQSTQGSVQPTPVVVAVPTQAKQPTTERRPRRPAWWTKPPVLATGVLLVLVVELAAYAGLGLLWWAVANAVVLVLLFGGALVLRRRGQGAGLLARLRPGAGRVRAGGQAARSRAAGLPRLGGGGRGGAAGGSRGGGLRSRLPRLFGGAGRQRSGGAGGTGGGAGGGGRTAGRRGLAGLLRGGRRGGGGSPAGGSGSGGRSGRLGFRNPLRGRGGRAGGASAGGAGRTAGRTGGRGLGLLGRGGRTGSMTAGGAGARKAATTGRRGPSKLNPLAWKSWRPGDVGKEPANRATAAKPAAGKPSPKPAGDQAAAKPSTAQKPEPSDKRPAAQQRQAADNSPTPKPVPVPKPRHAAAPTPGGDMTSPMSHSDDQSLQRWGRNLTAAEQAAEEVRKKYAEAEAAAAQYRQVMEKINTQYQTEMPPSGRLAADLDSVVSRARRASTADEWASVVTDAAALPTTYKREHETDEDRLDAPRGSRAAEKRADISAAEQDV